jgi:hypothetical protein
MEELRIEMYTIHIRTVFTEQYRKALAPSDCKQTSRIHYLVTSSKRSKNSLALLQANRQIHAEASDVLFNEVEPWLYLRSYVSQENPDKPLGIFCDEKNGGTKFKATPNMSDYMCFSTFDMDFLARFRAVYLVIITGPQFGTARDYNGLRAVLQRYQTALTKENSTNYLPSTFGWNHAAVTPDDDTVTILQKFRKAEKASVQIDTLKWMFDDVPNLTLSTNTRLQSGETSFMQNEDEKQGDNLWCWENSIKKTWGYFQLNTVGENGSHTTGFNYANDTEEDS